MYLTDEQMEALQARIEDRVMEKLNNRVYEALDWRHSDRFRMAWMRIAESELNDLELSTIEGACNHGQFAYRAIYRVIWTYLSHHTEDELRQLIGSEIPDEEPDDEDEYEGEDEEGEDTEEYDVVEVQTEQSPTLVFPIVAQWSTVAEPYTITFHATTNDTD